MLSTQKIDELRSMNISTIDKNMLTDISRIKLDNSLPKEKRMARILKTVKNPYCFRFEDMGIKVEFTANAPSLHDTMEGFLIRQKSGI